MITRLETERLILRKPIPADYPAMERFYLDDRSKYIRAEAEIGKAWRSFAMFFGHWDIKGFGLLALTLKGDNTAFGMAGPYDPADWPEPELGWSLWDAAYEGKGYINEAITAIRAHLYRDCGWTTVVSYIDPENARSIAAAERLGCVLDADAARPAPEDLVYRHPGPEALL